MTKEINYKNNPLNGVNLKNMLTELVSHYGFDILFAYLNINCFKTNPSIESSVKFLKKTVWAREKVELFYLYKFKSLPKVSSEQFETPPRDRIVPDEQTPGEPAVLTVEEGVLAREKSARQRPRSGSPFKGNNKNYSKSRVRDNSDNDTQKSSHTSNDTKSDVTKSDGPKSDGPKSDDDDPWAKWR